MGLYSRYIGPRIITSLCGQDNVTEERRKVLPAARGTVVEIGIGPAHNLALYDPTKVERVIGVDPGTEFIALGEERWKDSPVPLQVIQAPAENIPLEDNIADTAVLTYTLCSVDDPAQALSEIRRVLKPDGKLLFLEHGRSNDASVAKWQDRLNGVWNLFSCGCQLNRDTAALLSAAGFRIESIERFYLPGEPKPMGFHCRGLASAA